MLSRPTGLKRVDDFVALRPLVKRARDILSSIGSGATNASIQDAIGDLASAAASTWHTSQLAPVPPGHPGGSCLVRPAHGTPAVQRGKGTLCRLRVLAAPLGLAARCCSTVGTDPRVGPDGLSSRSGPAWPCGRRGGRTVRPRTRAPAQMAGGDNLQQDAINSRPSTIQAEAT